MSDTTGSTETTGATVSAEEAPPEKAAPFRWHLATRPDIRFGHAAGGVAGLLVAAAVVAFVAAVTDDDPTLPGVGFTLLLIVAALAAGYAVRGPVRSAAVSAIVVAVPLLWAFAIVGDGDDLSQDDFRAILILSIAAYLIFYFALWTRGRNVLLGFALAFIVGWLVFEIGDQSAPLGLDLAGQIPMGDFDDPRSAIAGQGDDVTDVAVVELILGLGYLFIAAVFDRTRRFGVATPFLVVGTVTTILGAITLSVDVDDTYATGIFVALAGIVIGLAGSLPGRRATSWLGALVLLVGTVIVVGNATSEVAGDDGEAVFGAFALVGAAVLLGIGILLARGLAEPIDGGEPFTPRPPKPPKPTPDATPTPVEPAPEPVVAAGTPTMETEAPPPPVPPPTAAAPAAPPSDPDDTPATESGTTTTTSGDATTETSESTDAPDSARGTGTDQGGPPAP